MFFGKHYNCIDAKGRMIMPAKFREQLGRECIMTIGADGCIEIYTIEEFQQKAEDLKKIPKTDVEARDYIRKIFSNGAMAEIDKQGRVMIPPELRDYAEVEKDLVTTGAMDKIEVWSRSVWDEREKNSKSFAETSQDMTKYGI